ERATGGTHRARRIPQPPAPPAALDQELAATDALPEEEVVAMDARPGPHHSGSPSPISFRAPIFTIFGARSRHSTDTWPSDRCAGSTTWPSTLTRISSPGR